VSIRTLGNSDAAATAPATVWDVVELEIEEDPKAEAREFTHRSRAFGCEKLAPDFEQACHAAKLLRQS